MYSNLNFSSLYNHLSKGSQDIVNRLRVVALNWILLNIHIIPNMNLSLVVHQKSDQSDCCEGHPLCHVHLI